MRKGDRLGEDHTHAHMLRGSRRRRALCKVGKGKAAGGCGDVRMEGGPRPARGSGRLLGVNAGECSSTRDGATDSEMRGRWRKE